MGHVKTTIRSLTTWAQIHDLTVRAHQRDSVPIMRTRVHEMKLLFHRPGLSDKCQKSKVICASQLRSIDSCQNGTCEDHYQITNNVGSNTRSDSSRPSKGQCPYYAHARASSVLSSKDNRTVILTRQDFLPDHTADGDLLFTFLSNILDIRRSLSFDLKEDSSRFYR